MGSYPDTNLLDREEGTYDYKSPEVMFYERQLSKIGYYGRLRRKHLVNNRRPYYISLLKSGKLEEHLRDIDNMAHSMTSHLMQVLYDEYEVHSIDSRDREQLEETLFIVHRQIEEVIMTELVYL